MEKGRKTRNKTARRRRKSKEEKEKTEQKEEEKKKKKKKSEQRHASPWASWDRTLFLVCFSACFDARASRVCA